MVTRKQARSWTEAAAPIAQRHIAGNEDLGCAVIRLGGDETLRTRQEAQSRVDGIVAHEKPIDLLARSLERQRQCQLRAEAVSIRIHMPAYGKRIVSAQRFRNGGQGGIRLRGSNHGATTLLPHRHPHHHGLRRWQRFARCAMRRGQGHLQSVRLHRRCGQAGNAIRA